MTPYPDNTFDYYETFDHQKLRFGDVEAAFATADHIVEGRYQMSPIEQAPMETCGAITVPETNDRFTCYTSTQALFFSPSRRRPSSWTSSLPASTSLAAPSAEDSAARLTALSNRCRCLVRCLTGKPVKFMWDREEEMQVGAPPRRRALADQGRSRVGMGASWRGSSPVCSTRAPIRAFRPMQS